MLGRSQAIAAGLLQATSLPFLVTAATIGMQVGTISPTTGAALICAGLLSVVFFPSLAVSRLRDRNASPTAAKQAEPTPAAE
jgi:hypothetical protein